MKHSGPLSRATQGRPRGSTWSDEQFRAARERDLRERTAAVPSAVVSALTCLLLAALLTSGKLVEIAERQELGTTRDRQLAVAEGIDRVANFLSLNRPYDWIQDLRGIGEDAGERIDSIDEVAGDVPTTDDSAGGADEPVPGPSITSTSSTTSTTTTVAPGPLRAVSSDTPLRVYVAGDSQATYLGQAITTEGEGRALAVEVEDRISTSLARPDYFNWPAELAAVVEDRDPEAVVMFLGANDHQDMARDGERLVEGTPEWATEWRRRLELTLDLLHDDHRHVFWVTQPPMRDARLDEGIEQINALAEEVIASRSSVTAIDIHELFGGSGGFSERVAHDGTEIRARVDDGVHLSRSASSWVADLVFTAMDDVWEFQG